MASKTILVLITVAAVCIAGGVAAFFVLQNYEVYDIEYELDGGEFCIDPPSTYRSGEAVALSYPIKDGKAFAGWYLDEGRTEYFDGSTSNLNGTLKLYARWAPSSIGLTIWYDEVGDCDRGLSSYTMVGMRCTYYDIQSTRTGLLHCVTYDLEKYDYPDTQTSFTNGIQDEGWNPGLGDFRYDGAETIETVLGSKLCERYVHTYEDGATETHWIDENGIVFKQYYEYIGESDSDVKSKYITRTYTSHDNTPLADEYSVFVYSGIGITVTGNKEVYKPGELVVLKAEVGPGVTFGGWYGYNMRLLSTETTYIFEVGFDQTVFAMNSTDSIHYYRVGDGITCSDIFNTPYGTMYYARKDGSVIPKGWNSETYYGLDSGFYVMTASTPDDEYLVSLVQVGGLVYHDYTWKWNGDSYSISFGIDYDDYQYAKDLYPLEDRRQSRPYHERDSTFVTMSYEDERMSPYMATLVDTLIEAYKDKNSDIGVKDYLNYLLAFTQYIPYQTDEEYMGYSEYWKFPLETLFDNGGDCEDTSILFVALAHESMEKLGFDYDVALQILPGHMCAAVKTVSISGDTNPYGYLYGETTALNYKVGDIPSKMKDRFIQSEYYPNKSYTVEIE